MRTADRSGIRWLLAELPELVAGGILSAENAEALRQHYAATDSGEPRRIGFVLSAILGSLLVGGGIILLVAHNWDFLRSEEHTSTPVTVKYRMTSSAFE